MIAKKKVSFLLKERTFAFFRPVRFTSNNNGWGSGDRTH